VKPYPYERILRDSRINRSSRRKQVCDCSLRSTDSGARAALKEVGSALRRPLQTSASGGYARSRVRLRLGQTSTLDIDLHERLKKHKEYFEKHVAELGSATDVWYPPP